MKIEGLVAAAFTPFNKDGSVNLQIIPQIVDFLVKDGVSGLFICGSTGENCSMTLDERMAVTEAYCKAGKGKLVNIVHVGHNCLEDARTLAAHAAKIGVDAVGMIAPSYFKPPTVEDLVSCCQIVAEAAGKTPFYHYHIPSLTNITFNMADFLAKAEGRIPTLAGVKFTYENLMDFSLCLAYKNGKYDMLFGRDEILLAGLALGAKGAIGSTYNYSAPIFNMIIKAFNKGDMQTARLWQNRAMESIRVLITHGGLTTCKHFMRLVSKIDCGPCRLPVRTMPAAEEKAMEEELKQMGFFDWLVEARKGL